MIGLDDFGVLDAFLGFEGGFEKLQQVVGDADGDDLDGFGRVAGGPGLALVEFLFLLVEGFLNAPAQSVGFAQHPWRQSHFIGEHHEDLVTVGAFRGDPAPGAGCIVEHHGFIAQDEEVGGVVAIDGAWDCSQGSEVAFPLGDDISAFALFEIIGVDEVDDRAVIGYQGVLSFARPAAKGFGGQAPEGDDFVFESFGGGLDQGGELGPSGAGVESIDGADGGLLVFSVARIVCGVGDLVAIDGPDFPVLEFRKDGVSAADTFADDARCFDDGPEGREEDVGEERMDFRRRA